MSDLTFGTDELVPMVQADDWDDPRHIRGTDNTHTPKSYLRALACLKVLQEARVLLTDKYLQLFDINNNQVVLLRYYKLKPLQLRH